MLSRRAPQARRPAWRLERRLGVRAASLGMRFGISLGVCELLGREGRLIGATSSSLRPPESRAAIRQTSTSVPLNTASPFLWNSTLSANEAGSFARASTSTLKSLIETHRRPKRNS
jgi:hypothetical protein